MKIIPQDETLTIINVDNLLTNESLTSTASVNRHGQLLPPIVRCLISGPSNCGKSNVLLSLIYHENGLSFTNLYIFSKSLFQPKYKVLSRILNSIPEIGYFPFQSTEELIGVDDALEQSLFIFDDVGTSQQNKICEFFSHGRHKNLDCIYLGQSYSKIPKQMIRDNANLIILFQQDEVNLRHVFSDHINNDMTYDEFKSICNEAWKNRFGFLTINKENNLSNGRYRIGFDKYIII